MGVEAEKRQKRRKEKVKEEEERKITRNTLSRGGGRWKTAVRTSTDSQ